MMGENRCVVRIIVPDRPHNTFWHRFYSALAGATFEAEQPSTDVNIYEIETNGLQDLTAAEKLRYALVKVSDIITALRQSNDPGLAREYERMNLFDIAAFVPDSYIAD